MTQTKLTQTLRQAIFRSRDNETIQPLIREFFRDAKNGTLHWTTIPHWYTFEFDSEQEFDTFMEQDFGIVIYGSFPDEPRTIKCDLKLFINRDLV